MTLYLSYAKHGLQEDLNNFLSLSIKKSGQLAYVKIQNHELLMAGHYLCVSLLGSTKPASIKYSYMSA